VTRSERIRLRLTRWETALIERAAFVAGKTVSEFARRCLVEQANTVVRSQHQTVLSARDFAEVLRILDSDDLPRRLVDALERHRLADP
jgi:uncharacterized protein (DUF1778 family)